MYWRHPLTRTSWPSGPRRVCARNPATSERTGDGCGRGLTISKRTPGSLFCARMGSGVELQAFVADLECLHADLVVLRVEAGARPLAGPSAREVPTHDLLLVLIEQDDAALGATHLPVHGLLNPVPERGIAEDAALEHEVGKLHEAGMLGGRERPGPKPILDRLDLHFEPADFGKAALDGRAVIADPVDQDLEVVTTVRIVSILCWHGSSPRLKWGSVPASSAGCGR